MSTSARASAYVLAFEFGGTSPNFRYASPLWSDATLHTGFDMAWQRTERKTSMAFAATSSVKLEIERSGSGATTTAVYLPTDGFLSLQSLFSGPFRATSGSLAEWRALSGYGYQTGGCNRQGFNIQGQTAYGAVNGQNNARIGMYFNDQNDCSSPDSGRVVGGSTLAASVGGSGGGGQGSG